MNSKNKNANGTIAPIGRNSLKLVLTLTAIAVMGGAGSAGAQVSVKSLIASVVIGSDSLTYVPNEYVKSIDAGFGIWDRNSDTTGMDSLTNTHQVYGPNIYSSTNGIKFVFKGSVVIPGMVVSVGDTSGNPNKTLASGNDYSVKNESGIEKSITIGNSYLKTLRYDSVIVIKFLSTRGPVAKVLMIPDVKTKTTVKENIGNEDVSIEFSGMGNSSNNKTLILSSINKDSAFFDRDKKTHVEFMEYATGGKMAITATTQDSGRVPQLTLKRNDTLVSNVELVRDGNKLTWTVQLTKPALLDAEINFVNAFRKSLITSVVIGEDSLTYVPDANREVKDIAAGFKIRDYNYDTSYAGTKNTHEVSGPDMYSSANGIKFIFKGSVVMGNMKVLVNDTLLAGSDYEMDLTATNKSITIKNSYLKGRKNDSKITIAFLSTRGYVANVSMIPSVKTKTAVFENGVTEDVTIQFNGSNPVKLSALPPASDTFSHRGKKTHFDFTEYASSGKTMKITANAQDSGRMVKLTLKSNGSPVSEGLEFKRDKNEWTWTVPLKEPASLDADVDFADVYTIWFKQPEKGTLTVITPDGGTVTPNATTFKGGDKAIFTVKPENDYEVEGWYKNGVIITDTTGNTYTHTVERKDTIAVKLREKPVFRVYNLLNFETIRDGNPKNTDSVWTHLYFPTSGYDVSFEDSDKDVIIEWSIDSSNSACNTGGCGDYVNVSYGTVTRPAYGSAKVKHSGGYMYSYNYPIKAKIYVIGDSYTKETTDFKLGIVEAEPAATTDDGIGELIAAQLTLSRIKGSGTGNVLSDGGSKLVVSSPLNLIIHQDSIKALALAASVPSDSLSITWRVSVGGAYITPAGAVITAAQPTYTQGNQPVTLVAEIRKNGRLIKEHTLNVEIKAKDPDAAESMRIIASVLGDSAKGWDIIRLSNNARDDVRFNLNLPKSVSVLRDFAPVDSRLADIPGTLAGVRVRWNSNNSVIDTATGVVRRGTAAVNVALTATVLKTAPAPAPADSAKVTFNLRVIPEATGADNASVNALKNLLTWDVIKGNNVSMDAIGSVLFLPKTGAFAGSAYSGAAITWVSSDTTSIRVKAGSVVDTGVNIRKAALSKAALSAELSLTARIRLGGADAESNIGGLRVLPRGTVQPNDIVFSGESVVYNSRPQSIVGVRLLSAAAGTYTQNGTDVFDTTYIYYDSVKTVLSGLPVAVGSYRVEVTLKNRNFAGTKEVDFIIAPKPLTASMLSVDTLTAYTYRKAAITPAYSVFDNELLVFGRDFVGAFGSSVYDDNINAGVRTAMVSVMGIGNYTGTVVRFFTIAPKTVSIDVDGSTVRNRAYNGATALSGDSVTVSFVGLEAGDNLVKGRDYVFSSLNYNSRDVAAANSVTGTVALLDATALGRNYRLSGGAQSGNFFRSGVTMGKKAADTSDFLYRIDTVLYTGTVRPPVSVVFKTGLTNPGGAIAVEYDIGNDWTGNVPVERGSYPVRARVTGGANYDDGAVPLGTYLIADPLKPLITSQPVDTTVRVGGTALFYVTANSPNGGILSYQWYRNDTLIYGATAAAYSVSVTEPMIGADLRYHVYVKNSNDRVQIPDSVKSNVWKLEVRKAPRDIVSASVTVSDDKFIYDGRGKAPMSVTVRLSDTLIAAANNYTLSYSDSVNAGTVIVTVSGINDYAGSAFGSFVIDRKETVVSDLSIKTRTVQYTGVPLPVEVEPTSGRTGLGTVTATYNGSASAPVNVGDYSVIVSVADDGRNFKAGTGFDLGTYRIVKKQPTPGDFVYTIPTDHKVTGAPQGIGSVSVKGTEYGKLEVLYGVDATLPVEIGVYQVFASITGGANYLPGLVLLGDYRIADSTMISVSSGGRVIPAGAGGQAVVAPVSIVPGEFTAGPNPVGRQAGSVSFFWHGKALAGGSLFVFDASGNLVNKVQVADKAATPARREVGAWNLADAKGRPVAAGTYLVKGALSGRDGSKKKVSLVLGVR